MRIRLKTAALLAVLAAVAGFVAIDASKDTAVADRPAQRTAAPASAQSQPQTSPGQPAQANQPEFAIPERQALGQSQSPLFESQNWLPPPPKPTPAERAKAARPPPPVAPPLPYTFAGRLIHDGKLSLLLAKGDDVIAVKEGQTLDGVYKVESITQTQITLVYLPLNQKQTIPVITGLAATPPSPVAALGATTPSGAGASAGASLPIPTATVVAPPGAPAAAKQATIAWTGPQQVKMGTRFDVTLRVSSSQPLQAWPMQLRIDPNHFQVVTVKPGKLPGAPDPSFTYRMNPDGNIFIGASVQKPAASSDGELLALTLMPVKPAPSAEIAIASLTLQGAAGQVIPYDRPAVFRTTITP
jgi:hypothetical protein